MGQAFSSKLQLEVPYLDHDPYKTDNHCSDVEAGFGEVEEPEVEYVDDDVVPGGTEDPDQYAQNGAGGDNNNIVVSGDQASAGGEKKTAVSAKAAKKIPNEKRTTTPYMTKYERARVLGTRAQQIR